VGDGGNAPARDGHAGPGHPAGAACRLLAGAPRVPAAAVHPAVKPEQLDRPGRRDGDWTTYHRDHARSGYLPGLPDPARLTQAWSARLDGAVYGQPLVVDDRVLVAAEADSLYGLGASHRSGAVAHHIGRPVPLSELPCGNIDPLGITGTPVYDPATGLVFAVAEVTGPAHLLGVDAGSGRVRVRRRVDVPGMDPRPHQQRAALALSRGRAYVAHGGLLGDCGDYRGRVVASRTTAADHC
jgi:hypothetical protein